ncbi:hypothetical protein [Pseudomonas sp.]|uniref:hypothetical protein n=1 Tax=Pseudomonas sp. TaxID=306 RepID=UPI003FD7E292
MSGAAYAIMPVQGYDKMLSDAFNNLNNQFGSKLAALGTTGNYETLPVVKGGTGAENQADARANLGLGSVSTENIVPVTKGGTGGTTQAAARSGLGLGTAATRSVGLATGNVMELAASPPVVGNSSFALDGSRFISYLDGTTTGAVPGAPNAVGIRSRFADNSLWAIDIVAGVYQTAAGIYWRQVNASGVTLGWRLIYDNANTTRAADGTLKAI